MRKTAGRAASAVSIIVLSAVLGLIPLSVPAQDSAALEQGRQLAFHSGKGNCLACHMIEGGEVAGNMGPPLVAMRARFPSKEALHEQIYDARINNPDSAMPPYGSHEILSREELDKLVEYIWSL